MSEMPYENQVSLTPKRVYFTGITALVQGQGVCYERSYAASSPAGRLASDPCGYRDRRVALPSSANNAYFVGVAARNYAASSTGRWIEIFEPGSVAEIAVLRATTVGATVLTCDITAGSAGRFGKEGFQGKGSALALQTVALVASNDATLVGPVSESLDGAGSVNLKTITHTGKFTNAQVGDKVYMLGGSLTSDSSTQVTPGVYTIETVTSADVVVLTEAAAAATAHSCCFYVVRGNPTCLAKLDDGAQSGLVQWVTAKVSVEVIPALAVGGVAYVIGRTTLTAGACTATVPAASKGLRRKMVVVIGTLVTNCVEITAPIGLTTSAKNWTSVAKFTILATGNRGELSWDGHGWNLVGGIGIAP